jgi:phosphonoacetaldehyde hydrolase
MTSRPESLQAVILDWAGTTVDYGSLGPVVALRRAFSDRGVDITAEEARLHMGLLKTDHIRGILGIERVARAWKAMSGVFPNEEQVQSLYSDFETRLYDSLETLDVVPGVANAVQKMRSAGLRIGSTTGYTRPMLQRLMARAAAQGYMPDSSVTPDEVGGGRPKPWMCYANLIELKVFPPSACVKIGDTPVDIEEGQNAGMWTVGVAKTGNMVGLSEDEWFALDAAEREMRLTAARTGLLEAGADCVIDSLADYEQAFDTIEKSLRCGKRPDS